MRCLIRPDSKDAPHRGSESRGRKGWSSGDRIPRTTQLTESSMGGAFGPEIVGVLARFEDRSPWFRSRNALIIWALRSYFPTAGDLLEVGCGTGYVLAGLKRALPGLRLTGLEPGEEGLAIARERLPGVPLLPGDARHLSYDRAFDVVSAFDVIEHVDDDAAVLAGLFRAVRPGGGLLVTVPQHTWLWSAADQHAGHLRRYSRHGLTRTVQRAGFRVIRTTSFVSLALPALAARRLCRGRPIEYDFESEFRPRPVADAVLAVSLACERWLIARGISFPAGGSLLLLARRA